MKFKSQKEEQTAIQTLKQGSESPFWQLIVKALEESKDFIQKQIDSDDLKEFTPERYKLENELLKAKKIFIDTLIRTPENIASWLEKPETEKPKEFDPYAR